jgi:hypothetical protein
MTGLHDFAGPGRRLRAARPVDASDAQESERECLSCGCMEASDDMGKPEINVTHEHIAS